MSGLAQRHTKEMLTHYVDVISAPNEWASISSALMDVTA